MGGKLLYFIYNRYTGLIKVGITNDLTQRVFNLECAAGVPLEVLGTLDQASDLEGEIHAALFQTRARGEWFQPTEDLLTLARGPSRPAILALLEKYSPAVRERQRELSVIDEAKQAAKTEQKRLIAEERKRLAAIQKEKELKAAERRAKKKAKEDEQRHQEMEAWQAKNAEVLSKHGLYLEDPERKKQAERNLQFIGLRGGIS